MTLPLGPHSSRIEKTVKMWATDHIFIPCFGLFFYKFIESMDHILRLNPSPVNVVY